MQIKVKTHLLYEQGMEGVAFCLYDPSKTGWAGHIDLSNGDYLEVPGIFKDYIRKTSIQTGNPFKWTQEGWSKEEWRMIFYNKYDAIYRKGCNKTTYTKDFNLII